MKKFALVRRVGMQTSVCHNILRTKVRTPARRTKVRTPARRAEIHTPCLTAIIFLIICIGASLATQKLKADSLDKERTFFLEERITLKGLPQNTGDLRIWIPHPIDNRWQTISDFRLASPFEESFVIEKRYGNRIIHLKSKQGVLDEGPSQIALSFKVRRKEYSAPFDLPASRESLWGFLKPNRLVPVNGKIKALAEKITQGKANDLERARAIYDYIIEELTYSKDDPKVCGIGDSLLTLEVKKGICTDYHSLFISLVRSLGIPAKFEIGFPIPEDKGQGRINGYHCWAKFYLKDRGWVPVDISEADRHPERRDYFFGHIDENRVQLTTGRDLELKYAKSSQPLNFFVYPYAELGGRKFDNMDVEVRYIDLKGGE